MMGEADPAGKFAPKQVELFYDLVNRKAGKPVLRAHPVDEDEVDALVEMYGRTCRNRKGIDTRVQQLLAALEGRSPQVVADETSTANHAIRQLRINAANLIARRLLEMESPDDEFSEVAVKAFLDAIDKRAGREVAWIDPGDEDEVQDIIALYERKSNPLHDVGKRALILTRLLQGEAPAQLAKEMGMTERRIYHLRYKATILFAREFQQREKDISAARAKKTTSPLGRAVYSKYDYTTASEIQALYDLSKEPGGED